MNEQLSLDLITQLGVPLILAIVRAHKNATGEVPTLAQVVAVLDADADLGIAVGQAFLKSKQTASTTGA